MTGQGCHIDGAEWLFTLVFNDKLWGDIGGM